MMRVLSILLGLVLLVPTAAHAKRRHGLPWCGIYLSKYFGKSDRSLWLARNWAKVGSPASGPAVGTIVVWSHHVGVIQGRAPDGEWIVHSGNDGGRIRTRPRSVAHAIAFRWPA